MVTEKSTIKCEAVFNEEHTHRFSWKRVWGKDKPVATIIMLNPCQADDIIMDTTTSLVVNNIARLEQFSGVEVLNLFSLLTSKLNFRWNSDEDLNQPENDSYIQKVAASSPCIIVAWGKSADTHQRIANRAQEVLGLLEPYRDKVHVISDGVRDGLHPLTPAIRSQWTLKPFDWSEYDAEKAKAAKETAKATKKAAKATKKVTKETCRG